MTLTRRRLIVAGGAAILAGPGLARTQVPGPDPRDLTHDPDQPVLGNPDGDVTLVEFYDYQCPYCRAAHPQLLDLVRRDGNLRLVMKDWPIFGEASVYAVRLGLGAVALGRYAALNEALMTLKGRRLDDRTIDATARQVGLDPVAAVQSFEAESGRWAGLIARNAAQAQMLGLFGTPSYVVGMDLFPGATEMTALRRAIAEARKG